jgi:OOP family OmpA-OmpF porin
MRDLIESTPWASRYDDSRSGPGWGGQALKGRSAALLPFEFDSADMIRGQEPGFQAFVGDLKNLLEIARGLDRAVQVEIVGHADSLGTESGNLILSQERAKRILDILLQQGLDGRGFKTSGLGSMDPLKEEQTEEDRELNRRVTFRVSG